VGKLGLPSAVGQLLSGEGKKALSTGAAKKSAKSGGILGSIFGSASPRLAVPLSEALPNVPKVAAAQPGAEAPKAEITTLKNGVRIATEATYSPTASIGLYVDAGSVNEHPQISGVCHLLEHLAYTTTASRSSFRTVREIEAIGAHATASASREQMVYSIDGIRTNIPEMLEVVVDSALNSTFPSWEVADKLKSVEGELKQLEDNPQGLLLEAVNTTAYAGALANPLVCTPASLKQLNSTSCEEFVSENYRGARMVLAVSGAEHNEVLPIAEQLLAAVPEGPKSSVQSMYTGGEFQQNAPGDMTHMILAFEYNGGWKDLKGSVVMTVLQMLLGGGGSFSAGGPGKGMHSRLYTRVLNNYPWVANCTAFSNIYNDTGLVGVFSSCDGTRSGEMVGILCSELEAVANGKCTAEELERAKSAALASVWMNLESNAIVSEDIGRQVLTYGKHISASEFIEDVKSISVKDISGAVATLLKTPPTLVSIGDVSSMPRVEAVARHFA